ncbi:MAG: EF-P lysine aminoacylase GenX [Gammaproteobacteria bacterium]|nr:EF-P lysine aminoacylase GenX [Gammaproteobacteria bacterium]
MTADWWPSATRASLATRAAMLSRARVYFACAGVLEVETPQLSHAAVSDVHLESVPAQVQGQGPMYLHTSPEYAMKRLLASGIGDCWQMCRVFRDGERGRHHNPEFTLLEWYRLGFDVNRMMDDVEAAVAAMLANLRKLRPAERLTYREALERHAGVDPATASAEALVAALATRGIEVPAGIDGDRDALLDLIVSVIVGPALGRDRPTFVHEYPASQAALARLIPGRPWPVAARFELYIDGVELANGFEELADPAEQRSRFEVDNAQRRRRGLPVRPLDERFLAALEHGMPDCSGVALGFDRLLMVGTGAKRIEDVIAFPIERA